jgi:hypothetical protein
VARLRRRLRRGPKVHGVSVRRELLDADLVAELHEHVEVVMTWPVNDLYTLDDLLEMGVTGVISDEDHVLAAVKTLAH